MDFRTAGPALRPLWLTGLAVAAVRYGLEWLAPAHAMAFGVYYVVVPLAIVLALRGRFDALPLKDLLPGLLIVGALVWGLPNLVAYGTAQFQGWTHGRFAPDRGPPPADSLAGKIGATGLVVLFTTAAGTLLLLLAVLIFGRATRRLRAPRAAPPS
jgi:hypothetical protein